MTRKMQTPVLAGTGAEVCSSSNMNTPYYSEYRPEIHRSLQAARLRQRFGMPQVRADLIASMAFGGRNHG